MKVMKIRERNNLKRKINKTMKMRMKNLRVRKNKNLNQKSLNVN
jgi:hypothetical protein